jgi:hypothetical protein
MAQLEKIEKIKKISKGAPAVDHDYMAQQELKRVSPNKEEFDRLLQAPQNGLTAQKELTAQKTEHLDPKIKSSPIDELRDLSTSSKPTRVTPAELVSQTEKAINKLDEVKGKFQSPDLQIPDSVKTLMQNKITHLNENIRIALSKTGAEYQKQSDPVAAIPKDNPVLRFLGLVTHSQFQLQNLAGELEKMHLNNKEISPANLLAIQIKVGYIQQELEFFSSLLNKALESTKTIMNVQV